MEILSTESELLKLHSSSASLVTSGLSLKDNPFGIGLCLYETDFDLGKNPGSSVDGSFTDSSIDWLPFLTTGEFLVKKEEYHWGKTYWMIESFGNHYYSKGNC